MPRRKSASFAARALLLSGALLLLAGPSCDLGGRGRDGPKRDSILDPLVRERMQRRMDEIYSPAKAEAEEVRSLAARKECSGVCEMSKRICDASYRICDLASDFPRHDFEVQERCRWASADCDSARVACAGCGGLGSEDEEDY